MNIKQISPGFYVSDQAATADLASAAARGITTIVNNRPDGESPDQPGSAALAAAAAELGLDYVHLPVVASAITEHDVARFAATLASDRGPVLAFCRSGMRSMALWALAHAERMKVADILATASDAGYDLSPLQVRLAAKRA